MVTYVKTNDHSFTRRLSKYVLQGVPTAVDKAIYNNNNNNNHLYGDRIYYIYGCYLMISWIYDYRQPGISQPPLCLLIMNDE